MINDLSDFSASLIASIIAITLVEMILPNNKNKKYVTFVSATILVIVTINPIISLLNKDLDLEKILESGESALMANEYTSKMEHAKEYSIEETYKKVLKEDIIMRLEENGYLVRNVSFEIDKETYEPIKMEIEIEHNDGDTQQVIIDVSQSVYAEISSFDIAKVKTILNSAYQIERKNIFINE